MSTRFPARALRVLALACTMFTLAACARPAAPPTAIPGADVLSGRWEQFIPVGGLPVTLELDPSGSAAVGGAPGQWLLKGDRLTVKHGGVEDVYSYTVSGYILTLYDLGAQASGFYVNPALFASGADRNAELAGVWSAWAGGGRMAFDGRGALTYVEYTTAGDTKLDYTYAARDGILQAEDASGGYAYNLYSFSEEGALLLAETTDYDNDVKQWTPYWKRADPKAGPVGQWTRALGSRVADAGLPENLRIDGSGGGEAASAGGGREPVAWEIYEGGFVVLSGSWGRRYAWCDVRGGVLYLGDPDTDEAWYYDDARWKPSVEPLAALEGNWSADDGSAFLTVDSGTLAVRSAAGEESSFDAAAADGLMKLTRSGKTFFAAYSADEDVLRLYAWGVPVLGGLEMPVIFSKADG